MQLILEDFVVAMINFNFGGWKHDVLQNTVAYTQKLVFIPKFFIYNDDTCHLLT